MLHARQMSPLAPLCEPTPNRLYSWLVHHLELLDDPPEGVDDGWFRQLIRQVGRSAARLGLEDVYVASRSVHSSDSESARRCTLDHAYEFVARAIRLLLDRFPEVFTGADSASNAKKTVARSEPGCGSARYKKAFEAYRKAKHKLGSDISPEKALEWAKFNCPELLPPSPESFYRYLREKISD
jgi:hypothetical protein